MKNKIIAMMMLMMLIMPLTLAEEFTQDVSLSAESGKIKLVSEDGTRFCDINGLGENETLIIDCNYTLKINRTSGTGDFNYSRVQSYIEENRVDEDKLQIICSEEIDQAIADHQAFIKNTWMKSVDEINVEKDNLFKCTVNLDATVRINDKLQTALNFMNISKTEYTERLEKDVTGLGFILMLIFVLGGLVAIFLIYGRIKPVVEYGGNPPPVLPKVFRKKGNK